MPNQEEQWGATGGHGGARTHRGPDGRHSCPELHPDVLQRVRAAAAQTGDLRAAAVLVLLTTGQLRVTDLPRLQIEHLTWDGPRVTIGGPSTARTGPPVQLSREDSAVLADYLAERMDEMGSLPAHGPLLVGERGALTRVTIYTIVQRVVACAPLTPDERRQITPTAFRTAAVRALRGERREERPAARGAEARGSR